MYKLGITIPLWYMYVVIVVANCLQVGDVVFGAGQIGLEPSTMTLATPSQQAPLSLTHVQSVLQSCDSHLTSALCGVCYYTTDEAGWCARQTWVQVGDYSCIPSLPEHAEVWSISCRSMWGVLRVYPSQSITV